MNMTNKLRQKLEYLENEKSFLSEIKSIFNHFERAFTTFLSHIAHYIEGKQNN